MVAKHTYSYIKLVLFLLFFFSGGIISRGASLPESITTPASVINPAPFATYDKNISPLRKWIEKSIGRKLKLKERIALKLLQWKQKRQLRKADANSLQSKAKWSVILGILGIVLVFVPFGLFFSIAAMAMALILGYSVKAKDPSIRMAKTGIVLGWIGMGLLLFGIAVAIVTL